MRIDFVRSPLTWAACMMQLEFHPSDEEGFRLTQDRTLVQYHEMLRLDIRGTDLVWQLKLHTKW